MEYSELQKTHRGFSVPHFDPNFKIPIKNQPLPPGTELPPPPPPPDTFTFPATSQSPILSPLFVNPQSQPPLPPSPTSRPRKRTIDYLQMLNDSELPEELRLKFQALHCLLCDAKVNSPISARMHYESKQHDKKVNIWLAEWSKTTGIPVVKRQRKPNVEGPKGPNAFFCQLCQIKLTSVQHANQHYTGKRHRLVAAGKSCPKGSGYYDNDGNWVKLTGTSADPGRFGIGQDFVKPETSAVPEPPPEEPPSEPKDPNKYCALCNVHVTSAQQMEMHVAGSKHLKNCKKNGYPVPPPAPLYEEDTILDSYGSNAAKFTTKDFSIYRTPSGQFYCNICNFTAPNEGVFSGHIQSKKHLKMTKEKR